MTAPQGGFQVPPGMCVVTTYGQITGETAQCLMDMRSRCEAEGLRNILWKMIPGTLVEKARNEAVRQSLAAGCQWLLQVDGDMIFQPDALLRLLATAYRDFPNAHVVGGYCNLRGDMGIPTVDTGTGTWESWYPNSGVVDVMRTGAAFLLVKRQVFEGLSDPWFRMRVPFGPFVHVLAEFDNLCRIKFDGKNPVREQMPEFWGKLEGCVMDDPSSRPGTFVPVEVGEDSGFCDRVKAAGFTILVDTNVVIAHLDKKVITADDHRKAMQRAKLEERQMLGVLT